MDDTKKIKEPYTPENTPNPPQIIDPIKRNEEPGANEPIKANKKGPAESKSKEKDAKPAEPEHN
jgi:hypothetical protein